MDHCDKLIDAVLRASGSGLKNYTLAKTKDGMRCAVTPVVAALLELMRQADDILDRSESGNPIQYGELARALDMAKAALDPCA